MKLTYGDKVMHLFIGVFLIILGFVTLYPFWNSLVISLNVGSDTAMGGLTYWPRQFTWDNYKVVFQDERLIHAFLVTVSRTVAGTVLSIFLTSLFAYGMSKKGLLFKKYYMILCIVTMYFSGGLIPSYLLIRSLHLMDTFWVMIIPGVISVWNMIIFRTFFLELPSGLEESAKLDGCGDYQIFFRIVLPLSGPVMVTLSMFTAIGHWNDWFGPSIYIQSQNLIPIQTLLNQIQNSNALSETMALAGGAGSEFMQNLQGVTQKSLVMATMMVATLPIIIVYPFIQKHFVKGVLVGSLKG